MLTKWNMILLNLNEKEIQIGKIYVPKSISLHFIKKELNSAVHCIFILLAKNFYCCMCNQSNRHDCTLSICETNISSVTTHISRWDQEGSKPVAVILYTLLTHRPPKISIWVTQTGHITATNTCLHTYSLHNCVCWQFLPLESIPEPVHLQLRNHENPTNIWRHNL